MIRMIMMMNVMKLIAIVARIRTNVKCKRQLSQRKAERRRRTGQMRSICISKHGICLYKSPLVSGNAPNTPPSGIMKRGDCFEKQTERSSYIFIRYGKTTPYKTNISCRNQCRCIYPQADYGQCRSPTPAR